MNVAQQLLSNLDPKNLPATLKVTKGTVEIQYFRTRDGYYGIPVDTKTGRVSRFGHSICLFGEKAGYVSPPVATNWIVQMGMGLPQGERVPREMYNQTIADITAAIVGQAMRSDTAATEAKMPKGLKLIDGEIDTKTLSMLGLIGAPSWVEAHASAMGKSIEIDVRACLQAQVNGDFVGVKAGAWTAFAEDTLLNSRLPLGLKVIAKLEGLTFCDPNECAAEVKVEAPVEEPITKTAAKKRARTAAAAA